MIFIIISGLIYLFGWYLSNAFNQIKIKKLEARLRQAYNRKGWLMVKHKKLYKDFIWQSSYISKLKKVIGSKKIGKK